MHVSPFSPIMITTKFLRNLGSFLLAFLYSPSPSTIIYTSPWLRVNFKINEIRYINVFVHLVIHFVAVMYLT